MNFYDELKFYYQHLFPADQIWNWLQYKNDINITSKIQFREFAFTLGNGNFYRYKSFTRVDELKQYLLKILPVKIHVGGEYKIRPKSSNAQKLYAFQKELVFDIDLSDFDDVRKCCKGHNICSKCWKYMRVACKVVDAIIKEDFGFSHLLWVFSGGRGIHLWICDSELRTYNYPERVCILNYVSLQGAGSYSFRQHFKKKILNPSIIRSADIIDQYFQEICLEDQKILETQEDIEKFLLNITNFKLRTVLREIFQVLRNSRERWNAFEKYYQENITEFHQSGLQYLIEEIKIVYVYPRFDSEVTKDKEHILKVPFSIHPASNRICIVFDVDEVDEIDPTTLPSLQQVLKCNPYDIPNAQMTVGEKILEKNLFLKKSHQLFKKFIRKLEEEQ